MTRRKIETPHAKTCSAYEKKLNRKKLGSTKWYNTATKRKELINKYELFVKHLLKNNRTTKQELSEYITKK